ncbi:MAG: hypothetical protein H7Y59_18480 [Anaerolineales bacterium]|nr:hypothetical protein [Anaerolineales bacterium]
MTSEDKLLALAKEVHNSKALIYVQRIETLQTNFFVFQRNYEELMKLIKVSRNPKKMFELWALRNRHKLEVVISEILRLLHNFLASAETLVSHTRIIMNDWYDQTEFLHEYKTQIKNRFIKDPRTGFIKDLRNFNLHYSFPVTHATFSLKADEKTGETIENFSFVLIKSSLLQWKNWNERAKTYLISCNEEIDIGDLVNEYYKEILDFHNWIVARIYEIHKEDFVWYEEMRQKTLNAMSDEEKKARGII